MRISTELFALALVSGLSGTCLGATPTYVVVDTAQTNCYDNANPISAPAAGQPFYGQDAQFQGAQFSLRDNGDGTITDLNTGLMWQQTPDSNGNRNQQGATDYCTALQLAGHNDWRLPSAKELYSISDFSRGWPYLNTTYFKLGSGTVSKDEQYWSSTYYVGVTLHGGSAAAFGVNHGTGHIKAYPADGTGAVGGNYVRAVRGPVYGINELVSNGDGTISDWATGLMWPQADNGSGIDWEHALAWAQAMNASNYLGHSDWRLPNCRELQSLVDYTRSPTATNAANVGPAINPLFSCTGITNEAGNADYPYYWTSTSAKQSALGAYYYAWYVAFGTAVAGTNGMDLHGAGAVRYDTKVEGGPKGEGGERIYNYVRLVRTGPANEDSVGDGIPDWWRRQYFGGHGTTTNSQSCATCDPDGDGAVNSSEYVADTNPTNALSYFHIESVSNATGFVVFYASSASRKYTLSFATNLTSGAWSNISSQMDIPGSGGVDSLSDPAPADAQRFYRIGVRVP